MYSLLKIVTFFTVHAVITAHHEAAMILRRGGGVGRREP